MGHVIKRILTKYQFYKLGRVNLRLELSLEVHEAYYIYVRLIPMRSECAGLCLYSQSSSNSCSQIKLYFYFSAKKTWLFEKPQQLTMPTSNEMQTEQRPTVCDSNMCDER